MAVHSDARGAITELAFGRDARLEPHDSPNSAWFCVIEGGGWVLVGQEHRRVAPGDAVAWPADVLHAAWTDHVPMRVILVELAGPDDAAMRGVVEGRARLLGPGDARTVDRGTGSLASVDRSPDELAGRSPREGEPL